VSIGILNSSLVHPRGVFADRAVSIILFHNHHSDDPNLSKDDVILKQKFVAIGKIFGIELTDHIIVKKMIFLVLKRRD
jgi:DNA repair protein RadC